MKQFNLKQVKLENEAVLDYQDALLDILRIKEQGMDLVEMEKALTCIGKIRQASNTVVLEDAEHAYLTGRVKDYRWRIADQAIVDFVKEVLNASKPDEVTASNV